MYIQIDNFGHNSSIKSMYCDGSYSCVKRIHQFPEIVCIIDGEVEITVDGVTETARAGDMAVITPFRTHSFRTAEYCKIWIGVVSNDFVKDFIPADGNYLVGKRAVFTPSRSLFDYVIEHLPERNDVQTVLNADAVKYRGVKALVFAVFEEYVRLVPKTEARMNGGALEKILLYLGKHFSKDISLDTVAEALGYTPTYVSHCIGVIPHMNFRRLLNSLRIDKAKILIIQGKLRIIDIAVECGFSSDRSFNRAFLDITGMTPTEYRKSKIRANNTQK